MLFLFKAAFLAVIYFIALTLLRSERPKLDGVLAILSAVGLSKLKTKYVFAWRIYCISDYNHYLIIIL